MEELFTQFGTVTEALLVMDKLTQRPRGFGFVTMGSAEEAQKAIEGLNGQTVDGRTLIVNEARPREDRPPRRDFGGGGGGGSRGGGGGYRGGGGGGGNRGGGGGYRDRGDRGDRGDRR